VLDRIACVRAKARAQVWELIENTPPGLPWLVIAGAPTWKMSFGQELLARRGRAFVTEAAVCLTDVNGCGPTVAGAAAVGGQGFWRVASEA